MSVVHQSTGALVATNFMWLIIDVTHQSTPTLIATLM